MSEFFGEHEYEPVRGLPGELPAGETLLWQGVPSWRRLAMDVFHVRAILVYFAALGAWRLLVGVNDGLAAAVIVQGVGILLLMALFAAGLLAGYAALIAQSTVYTITDRRVVIRGGIAMPKTWNLPFSTIRTAALRRNRDGSGDLSLQLVDGNRIAYLLLWPYARPWHLRQPQPLLRGLPDVERAADVLARALTKSSQGAGARRETPFSAEGHDAPVGVALG